MLEVKAHENEVKLSECHDALGSDQRLRKLVLFKLQKKPLE